jgi:membrane protease YdiL (CAAX protease family)
MPNRQKEREGVRLISLFYAAMSLVALGLIGWRQDSWPGAPLAGPGPNWAAAAGVTLGLVVGVHLLSRGAHDRLPSLRHGARQLKQLLGNLSPAQILVVASASGIGEELLFRGWLMHETGLWISSILFGLVHVPPTRQWLYWPFFAAAMGLALGWLYLWSGSLLFPILLHAGINFLNIRMLLRMS